MTLEKAAGELLGMGPSTAHRDSVHRTWFGTLLGESVVVLGLLLLYVAAVFLILEGLERSAEITLADLVGLGGWPVVAALFLTVPVAILVFKGLPTLARGLRERRLRPLAANPDSTVPGYFRLHPYDTETGGYMPRTDLRDRFIGRMLEGSGSLYYLSGASGVGKSSLVAAEIAPAFKARGWKVLDGRGIGDSYGAIASAVGRVEEMLDFPVAVSAETLARTAAGRAEMYQQTIVSTTRLAEEGKAEGLLIVVDQFEEFLILEDADKRAEFADLLQRFAKDPVPRVKLLLVFREDYRALLFKQGLPDYLPGQTGFEVAPFTRSEAEAFLKGGPKLMDAAGYDALFRGLDGVESARGLYRPITLNMVGLVLSRTGAQLTDDPARLVESYLADCLAQGRSRDFAKPVLQEMITTAGTKEPRSRDDLARLTGLEEWQVHATLVDLQQDGLVRPLARDGLWEVSHDFLARLMAGMLGRMKPPRLRRAAPWAIGAAAIGWAATVALAAPLYLSAQRDATLRDIRAIGFSRMAEVVDGYGFDANHWVGDDELNDLAAAVRVARLTPMLVELDLGGTNAKELGPLSNFTGLKALDIGHTAVRELDPLIGLAQLSKLYLDNTAVQDLDPLSNLTELTSLDLRNTDVRELGPLSGLRKLTMLDLSNTSVADLSPLSHLDHLTELYLGNTNVFELQPLSGLGQLTHLDLTGTAVSNLSALSELDQLSLLYLARTEVSDISPLSDLDELRLLDLGVTDVSDFSPVACLPALEIDVRRGARPALDIARAACP